MRTMGPECKGRHVADQALSFSGNRVVRLGMPTQPMKRWFCTDCGDTFRAHSFERCHMCGGGRVIGPVTKARDKVLPLSNGDGPK